MVFVFFRKKKSMMLDRIILEKEGIIIVFDIEVVIWGLSFFFRFIFIVFCGERGVLFLLLGNLVFFWENLN